MIDYEKLKQILDEKYKETEEYSKSLDNDVFDSVGNELDVLTYMKLKFFNIGYQNAIEMMRGVICD